MNKISTRKALNPAYRKHKPLRNDVTTFIEKLKVCIEAVKLSDEKGESEEHIKSHFKDFFLNTFYKDNYINTKERIDLAIYLDSTAKSDIGVIIEAKKPSNKVEFITENNLNKKALQELLLYYLRERLDRKNNNLKHLIATNGYEWFLFKAEDFYNYFYKNKSLIKEYEAFRDGLKDTTKNELFYTEIAKKYIEEVKEELPFVHLDFSTTNLNTLDDNKLNTYFKIFSNVHLLGHSFGNDSNQLNKNFYNELLHIIGLEEVVDGGKKVIQRKDSKSRDYASLLENTIFTLEDKDYLRKVNLIGIQDNKAFNVGLELCLTWINRILFLKLLESQLATYHKGAKEYKFLHSNFINGFDALNDLFFSALAKPYDERHEKFAETYKYIPYLNSSLFSVEAGSMEDLTFTISALKDDEMTVHPSTVLKDVNGKKIKGNLKTLDYLFKFLDAYDFATDGTEGIVEGKETKTLINASVLGLIFEKINGYKDGSFYTPAYITMYMCKETIRRTVVQKFKEKENDTIETFEDVKAYTSRFFKPDDSKRFNTLINSLRICDPAVGSGHFLVSALNELIVIKNELGILVDEKGIPLRIDIQIENDELYISDANGYLFEYNPNDTESARIQKTLFEEKQILIENCLFGVDINPNSVKICRLRLWIELLKNAYYTEKKQLHTLPNIDINIKCGNSLISRFNLQDDLKDAFKGKEVKYNFTNYKKAVNDYKNSNSKEEKYQVLEIINEVKNNFKSTLDNKFIDKVSKAVGTYENEKQRLDNLALFGEKIKKAEKDKLKKLKADADKFVQEKEDTINNAIYNNAFEWRFEFPEVLDDNGNYLGFDVVIGNPPYVYRNADFDSYKNYFKAIFFATSGNFDLYKFFIELSLKIQKVNSFHSFITNSSFILQNSFSKTREFILKSSQIVQLIPLGPNVFEEATVDSVVYILKKAKESNNLIDVKTPSEPKEIYNTKSKTIEQSRFTNNDGFIFDYLLDGKEYALIDKLFKTFPFIDTKYDIGVGINTGYIKDELTSESKINEKYHPMVPGTGIPVKYGKVKTKGFIMYDKEFVRSKGKLGRSLPDEKFFNRPKILVVRTRNISMKVRIVSTIDNNNCYNLNRLSNIISKDENSLEGLLGVLNSKLFNWIYSVRFLDYEIKPIYLRNSPLCNSNDVKLINKVNQILALKQENPEADTTTLEKEIDAMVYVLYGLKPDEIQIVENS
ncbi:Eco57I restriction-modification methylase domain-containing protein [Flavobacterium sp. FlaQc-28]|uniref:type IIG restriction enzyme/methyltransferase n=1 Tax=Flavobacterium sp. FlaQc-28 TaxID=3374178 RepID=UPI0037581CD0